MRTELLYGILISYIFLRKETYKKKQHVKVIKLPIDWGATMWAKPAENRMRNTGRLTHARYCTTGCVAKSLYNQPRAEM
jgi:hypothetical protein